MGMHIKGKINIWTTINLGLLILVILCLLSISLILKYHLIMIDSSHTPYLAVSNIINDYPLGDANESPDNYEVVGNVKVAVGIGNAIMNENISFKIKKEKYKLLSVTYDPVNTLYILTYGKEDSRISIAIRQQDGQVVKMWQVK